MGIMAGKHVLCKKCREKNKAGIEDEWVSLKRQEEIWEGVRQGQRSIYFCSNFNLTLISKQIYFHNELYTFLFVGPLSNVCLLSM